MADPTTLAPVDTGTKTITGRTIWNDPKTGEDYSERSTTFEIDGKYYTMPTVAENGGQYTDDTIREYVKENGPIDYLTGEELPEFRYKEDAIEYAISRSSTRKQTDMAQGGAIQMNNQMQQFGDGGLKDEGGEIDEVSGNEVPVGGTKEGVRDDIPANVSEGEFIFPEDVVRFIGLDKLMSIRQDAKMGLKKMDAMGQMGNGDEASMPDDMPFDMTDIIVVGDNEQPMEFAGGGFIPVEDYTVVQDMIEDRSDKAAAIDKDKAMSDMIADNTTKSAVIDKENEIQNFAPGGSVGSMAGRLMGFGAASNMDTTAAEKAPANTTFDNPTTGQEKFDDTGDGPQASSSATTGRRKLTFKEMMGDQYAEILIYSNEAGDKLVVPAINGVPIYAPPPGYTLYVPPVEGEEEVGEPLPPEAVAAIQNINSNNDRRLDVNGNRKEPPQVDMPKPVPWATMSAEDFIKETKKLTGTGRTIMEAALLFIPFVGLAGKAMLSHQDRTVQAIIAERKANGDFSAAQLTELEVINTALDKSSKGIFGAVVSAVGTALGAVGTAIKTALTGNDVIAGSEEPPIVIVEDGTGNKKVVISDAVETDLTTSAQMEENRLGIDPDGIAERAEATKKAAQDAEIQRMLANNKGTEVPLVSSVESGTSDEVGAGATAKQLAAQVRGTNDPKLSGGVDPFAPTVSTSSAINKLTDLTTSAQMEENRLGIDPRSEDQRETSAASIATTEVATSPIVNTKGGTDYYSILPVKKVDSQGGVLEFIKTGYNYVKDVVTTAAENNDNYNENARRDREAKAEAAALEAQKAEEAAAAKVAQAAEIQRMLAAQQAATVRQQAASNNNNNNNDNNNFTQPTRVSQATRDKINTASDNLDRATGPSGQSTVREDAGITFRKSDNDRGFTGGFNKGGLASKPKSKKKTTNKRGLAARK